MLLRVLLVLVVTVVILAMSSCKKKSEPAPTTTPEVKVTEENLDAELDKMESQIEADIAAEQ